MFSLENPPRRTARVLNSQTDEVADYNGTIKVGRLLAFVLLLLQEDTFRWVGQFATRLVLLGFPTPPRTCKLAKWWWYCLRHYHYPH